METPAKIEDRHDRTVVDNYFKYHKPIEGSNQGERYSSLRESARQFAHQIIMQCPSGDDRTVAIQKLREVVFIANASIACGEVGSCGIREID